MSENAIVQVAPVSESAAIMQVIERAAANPDVDVDKLERLLAVRERIMAKQDEAAFNDAMTAAQAEMTRVSADAENPQTHSSYASYAQLDRELRPIYTKHGFSLSFGTTESPKPDHIRVTCLVAKGGYSRNYQIDMPNDGKGAKGGDVMTKTHATGAATSYGSRYLLKMIFNVAVVEDDRDGNDPQPTLSEEQVANLDALLSEIGGDAKARYLRYAKVQSLDQILACNYADAVKVIEKRRAAP